jgi:hypothetical protein
MRRFTSEGLVVTGSLTCPGREEVSSSATSTSIVARSQKEGVKEALSPEIAPELVAPTPKPVEPKPSVWTSLKEKAFLAVDVAACTALLMVCAVVMFGSGVASALMAGAAVLHWTGREPLGPNDDISRIILGGCVMLGLFLASWRVADPLWAFLEKSFPKLLPFLAESRPAPRGGDWFQDLCDRLELVKNRLFALMDVVVTFTLGVLLYASAVWMGFMTLSFVLWMVIDLINREFALAKEDLGLATLCAFTFLLFWRVASALDGICSKRLAVLTTRDA